MNNNRNVLQETPCYERHTQVLFLTCDRKHDKINFVRKDTRFKNVLLSAVWTVIYFRSFIVNKTSRVDSYNMDGKQQDVKQKNGNQGSAV